MSRVDVAWALGRPVMGIPTALATRLRVYGEQTAPLLEHYRKLRLLRGVDASGKADAVHERLRTLLHSDGARTAPAPGRRQSAPTVLAEYP